MGTMTCFVCVCACVRACWGHACVRASVGMFLHACMYMCASMHVSVRACIRARVGVGVCVCVCVCVCLSTRICISVSSEQISFGFSTNMSLEQVYRFLSTYFDYIKVKVTRS